MKKPDFSIAKPALENVGPIQFVRQAVDELKKVSWPTRAETLKLTLVVLAVSVAVGAYIGGLDFIYTKLIETFLR
ncbi:preprotein translocase subunit SecE [Patescibacteria group bacterium]|nr:preprotein translocase subunit SecE [Patescibacteria group bacterium]